MRVPGWRSKCVLKLFTMDIFSLYSQAPHCKIVHNMHTMCYSCHCQLLVLPLSMEISWLAQNVGQHRNWQNINELAMCVIMSQHCLGTQCSKCPTTVSSHNCHMLTVMSSLTIATMQWSTDTPVSAAMKCSCRQLFIYVNRRLLIEIFPTEIFSSSVHATLPLSVLPLKFYIYSNQLNTFDDTALLVAMVAQIEQVKFHSTTYSKHALDTYQLFCDLMTHLFILLTGALQHLRQTGGQHRAEVLTQQVQNTRGADRSVAHTLRGGCLHHNRDKGMSDTSMAVLVELALPHTIIVI